MVIIGVFYECQYSLLCLCQIYLDFQNISFGMYYDINSVRQHNRFYYTR